MSDGGGHSSDSGRSWGQESSSFVMPMLWELVSGNLKLSLTLISLCLAKNPRFTLEGNMFSHAKIRLFSLRIILN